MISLRVILDGDGAARDLADRGLKMIHLGNDAPPMRLTYLSAGMESGKPSVALIIELPDGHSYVLAELSAQLLVTAAHAVAIKAEMDGFTLE